MVLQVIDGYVHLCCCLLSVTNRIDLRIIIITVILNSLVYTVIIVIIIIIQIIQYH